jgi:hypothetical protein
LKWNLRASPTFEISLCWTGIFAKNLGVAVRFFDFNLTPCEAAAFQVSTISEFLAIDISFGSQVLCIFYSFVKEN